MWWWPCLSCVCVRTHTCVCVRARTHTQLCACARMCAHTGARLCERARSHGQSGICVHTHVSILAHTHARAHTHTPVQPHECSLGEPRLASGTCMCLGLWRAAPLCCGDPAPDNSVEAPTSVCVRPPAHQLRCAPAHECVPPLAPGQGSVWQLSTAASMPALAVRVVGGGRAARGMRPGRDALGRLSNQRCLVGARRDQPAESRTPPQRGRTGSTHISGPRGGPGRAGATRIVFLSVCV